MGEPLLPFNIRSSSGLQLRVPAPRKVPSSYGCFSKIASSTVSLFETSLPSRGLSNHNKWRDPTQLNRFTLLGAGVTSDPRNPGHSCVSLRDDLKFPFFFLTPNSFTYRSYFLLDKRVGNRIQIKIFLFETFRGRGLEIWLALTVG